MNPIQKATYFAILNVLLPLQILTGVLMWGVQTLPIIARPLGGLTYLGTHSRFDRMDSSRPLSWYTCT